MNTFLFQYFSIACDEFATETSVNMVNTISYQVKKETNDDIQLECLKAVKAKD